MEKERGVTGGNVGISALLAIVVIGVLVTIITMEWVKAAVRP